MHDAPLPDDIVLDPRQLTRLLEDRGWTRAGLPARAGLEPGVLENAEASGVASRRVAEALAGAFGVPVALLSGKTPEARDYLARRSTRIAAMVAVIFVLSTFPMLIIAIVAAAMLNNAVRYSTALRIAYFVPNITSVVAMAVLFGSIFGENFGLANAALNSVGLPDIPWLSTPLGIQVTISILITYQWTGYNAIIFLAGMQSIGSEIYEAAKLDGAGPIRSFFSMTLPLLRPTIIFVLVVSTITGLQSFTEAQVLTSSSSTTNPNSGGAGQGGLTMVLYFYQQAFSYSRFGYGAAIAWGVFLIVVIFTIISWRFTAGRKEENTRA